MSYNSVSPTLIKCITEQFSDQKFTDNDVWDFIDDSIRYMKENVDFGTANEFVQEMNKAYLRYGSHTKGQTRGLLNCIRAEVLAADKQAEKVVTQLVTGIEPLNLSSIPSGRYAVDHGSKNGIDRDIAFYIIDNIQDPKSKWSGWVFVNILASDQKIKVGSQRPNQTYQGQHEDHLRQIKNNPYEAAVLFGRTIGKCSICGRTLTDPESIALGIGPICADKTGWGEYDRAALRALGYRI